MLRFDRNECALPPPDHVVQAVRSMGADEFRYYAVEAQERLVAELAARLGVDASNVAIGSGADDMLAAAIRTFAQPGDSIVLPRPTFGMYMALARSSGVAIHEVPYTVRWQLDPDSIIAACDASTKLVILGNPNNPTGEALERGALTRIAAELPSVLIVVDEVYVPFADASLVAAAAEFANVLVVASFSKAAALAGLRVGYTVGSTSITQALTQWMCPFPISAASLAAARAYVGGGERTRAFDRALQAQIARSLDTIVSGLTPLAVQVWRSCANFVLCDFGSRAVDIARALRDRGILVRTFDDPMIANCLRFCAADDASTKTLVEAIQEIYAYSLV